MATRTEVPPDELRQPRPVGASLLSSLRLHAHSLAGFVHAAPPFLGKEGLDCPSAYRTSLTLLEAGLIFR